MKKIGNNAGFLILLIGLCGLTVIAQNENFVICQENQGWILSGQNAAKIGECKDYWVVKLKVDEILPNIEKNPLAEKRVVKLLQIEEIDNFEIIEVSKTNLNQIISPKDKFPTIYIKSEELPQKVKKMIFDSLDKESMRLIVTFGSGYPGGYDERSRTTIIIKDGNTLIKTVLDEVKKKHIAQLKGTKDEWLLDYIDSYYLETKDTEQKLDITKTVADYSLKSGSILRAFSGSR